MHSLRGEAGKHEKFMTSYADKPTLSDPIGSPLGAATPITAVTMTTSVPLRAPRGLPAKSDASL
jgi:hypothetical protein